MAEAMPTLPRPPSRKEQMTKDEQLQEQWLEQAKAEAHKNLQGEELAKCIQALDNWNKNYKWSGGLHMTTIRSNKQQ